MSDTTDSTEKMHLTPDADGRDQLVHDGGDATLLIREGTELETMLDNEVTLPDPENSATPVIKCVLQWVKDSISLVAKKWARISDHKKKTMSNAVDGDIGHLQNKIYMNGMKSSDDTKVDDIRPQVGHFVSPEDPGVNVLASGRLQTDSITNWDRMTNNSSDGNSGYYVNEIDMSDLVSLNGTEVNNIETRVGRFVFPDDSGFIVSTSDNEIDMADWERVGDTKVGIIMSRGDSLSYQTVLKCLDFSIVFFKNTELLAECTE